MESKMANTISTYGVQQTNETIRSNIENWNALHSNKDNAGEMAAYNAEKLKKHKIRMIEAWRAKSAN